MSGEDNKIVTSLFGQNDQQNCRVVLTDGELSPNCEEPWHSLVVDPGFLQQRAADREAKGYFDGMEMKKW